MASLHMKVIVASLHMKVIVASLHILGRSDIFVAVRFVFGK